MVATLLPHYFKILDHMTIKQSDCKSCRSPKMIDYEEELVAVGATTLVDAICPYITANETVDIVQYYHINFSANLTEQTCSPLNRKGLLYSECYEGYMDQQSMHLVMSMSNVKEVLMDVGLSISLWLSFPLQSSMS